MDELGAKANCSNSTIRDFEAGRREPHRNRLATIRQALEAAGIVFSGDNGGMLGVAGPRGEHPRAETVEKPSPNRQRKPGRAKKRA